MRYSIDGSQVHIGDRVVVEGNVAGVVVCDFDLWECMPGHEGWLTREPLADGSSFLRGVLIKTDELGFLYYPEEDVAIARASGSCQQ